MGSPWAVTTHDSPPPSRQGWGPSLPQPPPLSAKAAHARRFADLPLPPLSLSPPPSTPSPSSPPPSPVSLPTPSQPRIPSHLFHAVLLSMKTLPLPSLSFPQYTDSCTGGLRRPALISGAVSLGVYQTRFCENVPSLHQRSPNPSSGQQWAAHAARCPGGLAALLCGSACQGLEPARARSRVLSPEASATAASSLAILGEQW